MAISSDSDVGVVLRPVGNFVGWVAASMLVIFPLCGLLVPLVYPHGWRTGELKWLWIGSCLILSTALHVTVKSRGDAQLRVFLGWTLGLVATVFLLGSAALATFLGTVDRGKQVQAIEDIKVIGAAVALRNPGELPQALTVAAFSESLPAWDPWGGEYRIVVQGRSYTVVSYGEDRKAEHADVARYSPGRTSEFAADIVLRDGELIRWPEGLAR